MSIVFSGVRPTGQMHLGNYLGAFKNWVVNQEMAESYYCIVDLHALAEEVDPKVLKERTILTAVTLLSIGLDPEKCTLFVQSKVDSHVKMAWLLSCIGSFGELSRMTQFKDKSQTNMLKKGEVSVKVALFTYPILMAADILAYGADKVPVGDDQKQHLELTRDIAVRFNGSYGDILTVPDALIPPKGSRIMDLLNPTVKMSKSAGSDAGVIYILDEPKVIEKKIKSAVTDSLSSVNYDFVNQPGVSNLLEIFSAITDEDPKIIASQYQNYGSLKKDLAEVLIDRLSDIRQSALELNKNLDEIYKILEIGKAKAYDHSSPIVKSVEDAMGLI
jgi:tryptophanyl-tRNA synthetase